MILTSKAATLRFTPPWLEKQPNAPVYLLRCGDVVERGLMEAELASDYGAGRVLPFELLEAFQTGVSTLLAGEPGLDEVLALAQAEYDDEPIDTAGQQTLVEVREILREHWPDYRRLVARMERRKEVAPMVAFRRFCIGFENLDVPFARGVDGLVKMDLLPKLPPLELRAAGNRAYGLQYGGLDAGNSERPSSSASGPETSQSDEQSPEAGN